MTTKYRKTANEKFFATYLNNFCIWWTFNPLYLEKSRTYPIDMYNDFNKVEDNKFESEGKTETLPIAKATPTKNTNIPDGGNKRSQTGLKPPCPTAPSAAPDLPLQFCLSFVLLSSVCVSVTFVNPTQPVEIFANVYMPSSKGNPSDGGKTQDG